MIVDRQTIRAKGLSVGKIREVVAAELNVMNPPHGARILVPA